MRRILSLLLLIAVTSPLAAEVANRIVARVNDRVLTLYDFEDDVELAMLRFTELPTDPVEREEAERQIARRVMRSLFDEMLILSHADRKGWSVNDREIDATVERMKQENGVEDDRQLAAALASEGLTLESWRLQLENQLLYRTVVGREVYSAIDIPEEDLRRYYRSHEDEFQDPARVQLRELVVLETADSAAMQSLAAEVLAELRGGKSPEDVAAERSDVLSDVIDLGWVALEDLDPTIAAGLEGVNPGEFSEPIAARGGLHVAQVLDRREQSTRPFNEIEPALRQRKTDERLNEKLTEFLIGLEKSAYLTLDPPPLAAGFRTATGETPLDVAFPLMPSLGELDESAGEPADEPDDDSGE